ncbi:hypothetical protein ASC77_17055 [Nocardioides sp. Root1257]|uniref:substrate-binding domain-containing protein n=1 Tax=unclassified Nocardioides TaxID=2615069 RepID=UPI0006F58F17|nr:MULTISPECIES: substrate-binding domain-containing protein [unclassified Nocardioides]KQW46908.1 hypothetical protein ASC77_17055 [Nocardioides sp. Root1257]KRC43655.1 hypothetical protein ASE24_18010 [Nocardioides sp. Root224]
MQIPRARRGLAALLAIGGASLALVAVPTTSAEADSDSTLTIVGTSDVSDSHLFLDVLKPGFEAAYPQYTVTYQGSATQKAIDNARQGLGSALIVHAASLENQFVGDGFSVEPFGRAIFWGDFVLLGPASDPAHVMSGSSPATNPTEAFQKIAAAGAAGNAFLVARETGSGTDVQSHNIWAETTGVHTCTVSTANGGGVRPAADDVSGACPTGAPGTIQASFPSWYPATGQTQAPNIQTADVCTTLPGGGTGNNNCYVFTDRGTFQYLKKTGIPNLQVVVRGDSLLLVNSFHAYAINPDKFTGTPSVQINKPAALAFLDWVTSTAGQAAVGSYLNDTADAPFLPSAAPKLTVTSAPAKVKAGAAIKVSGDLANVVPGTPALSGVPVRLVGTPAAGPGNTPVTVATTTTDSAGHFAFSYKPQKSLIYSVAVDEITQIENAALTPVFGDLLEGTSAPAGRTVVVGSATIAKPKVGKHRVVQVRGKLGPHAYKGAVVQVYGKLGAHKVRLLRTVHPRSGAAAYQVRVKLKKGVWKLRVRYSNGTSFTAATTGFSRKVKVS